MIKKYKKYIKDGLITGQHIGQGSSVGHLSGWSTKSQVMFFIKKKEVVIGLNMVECERTLRVLKKIFE